MNVTNLIDAIVRQTSVPPDNCGGCFRESECWVAGCDWSNPGGSINETCRAFTSP